MSKLIDLDRVVALVRYYNSLVDNFDIPQGTLYADSGNDVECDEYSIEIEGIKGTAILANGDSGIYYSVYLGSSHEGYSGNIKDTDIYTLVELIKKVL